MEKECRTCGSVLPADSFYKHSGMRDGYLNDCKECHKRKMRANREANIEYYREYDRKRGYHGNGTYKDDPKKRAARVAVNNAVRDGRLIKQPCEICGASYVEGHHDDYDKPLEVWWLCPIHHAEIHKRSKVDYE